MNGSRIPIRPGSVRIPTLCAAILLFFGGTVPPSALAAPVEELPVRVKAEVDATDLESTGSFMLTLNFAPLEDFEDPLQVRLSLFQGLDKIFERDHAPHRPSVTWKRGESFTYTISVPFPFDVELRDAPKLELRLGLKDLRERRVKPPIANRVSRKGLSPIATLDIPTFVEVQETDDAQRLIDYAKKLRADSRDRQAWDVLEFGIRRADEDALKYSLREEMMDLEKLAPPPIDPGERLIVDSRIEDEKARYFRLISGRMFDRKKFHGALKLLETVGGSLAERSEQAVIGDLNAATRVTRDADNVKKELLDWVPPEDLKEIEKAEAELGLSQKFFEKAQRLISQKRWGAARWILRKLRFADERKVINAAYELIPSVEESYLADMPSDQEAEVKAALEHPCWARTIAVPSHRFIFIGPEMLIRGIPLKSRLHFDLAYIFLTDLFGRVPNPAGDRVTVYYKELWNFGGGVGGGKIINIGNANPKQKKTRVDTGLLYHELTHCIDDTRPIFDGFREGLANVGAVYAFEALAQQADGRHSFGRNLEQFRADYLERDLEYWRIPNYGPSAGFFLHFLDRYTQSSFGHDWKPYRQFFREYRDTPNRDGRDPFVVRALAYYLMRAFGNDVFDDLVSFRFPLVEEDRGALALEMEGYEHGNDFEVFDSEFERFPGSPIPRDLLERELVDRQEYGDFDDVRAFGESELGLIYDWKVIGPFRKKGTDPLAAVFPPEYRIDFDEVYQGATNVCTWRDPIQDLPVILTSQGWVRIEYPYQDDTASYGLTHVTVPEDVEAIAHVRADDDLALFINDERKGSYRYPGRNAATPIGWRGPHFEAADAFRVPVSLRAGRNKVLIKVKNSVGPAGFIFALSLKDGRPIEGLRADAQPPSPAPDPDKVTWKRVVAYDFRSRSAGSKLQTTVGGFKVKKKALEGTDKKKRVAWRKYTVRPGFPKDSPSNLTWLRAKVVKKVDDFRLGMKLEARSVKIAITFMGDGGQDGLSGWTLIVIPAGSNRVSARLERYDRLVYQAPPTEIGKKGDEHELELTYRGERVWVTIDGQALFDAVPIRPIADKNRIGFATWGTSPRIHSLELSVPR